MPGVRQTIEAGSEGESVGERSAVVAACVLGTSLATGCEAPRPPPPEVTAATIAPAHLSDVRETVLRAVTDNDGYFTHYCIAVEPKAAPGPGAPSGPAECTTSEVDASPLLLSRLANLDSGYVIFNLSVEQDSSRRSILLRIEDSGKGFDYDNHNPGGSDDTALAGRGIMLIQDLCESLEYHGKGNIAIARFGWSTS